MKAKILLKTGDITTMEVDAIINSANNDLILGSGVSGAIRRLGGPAIQEECNRIGTIPLGEAAVTTAGQLKAKWIIHAAGIPLGLWADARSVRLATRNSMKRADDKKCKTVAFPAIGTGVGAFPIDKCAEIMFQEVIQYLRGTTGIEQVDFVLFDEKTFKVFEEKFNEIFKPAEGTPAPPAPSPETPAGPPPTAGPTLPPPGNNP